MDAQAQVRATMTALMLNEALKPLTSGIPLGGLVAGGFAKLIADRLEQKP